MTATDNFGCTSSQSYTVNNTSPIEVSIKRKLVNCFTHSSLLYVEYIATASGGQAPYTYKWFGLTGNTVLHTGNTYVNVGSYILEVTDANGCSRRFQVDPNIELISATSDNTPGFQTSYSNSILRFANDFTITKPWTLTNCDMVYTTMGQKTTIASPSAQAGMQLINSTIHTCGDFMARGIVMTKNGDYIHTQGSTLEDMYAAIAIEPANGQGAGTFYMPIANTVFKNNFIGIRINAPHINLDQTRISALGPFNPDYFSGNRFEGAATIKPYSAAFYPSSLISTLEKSYNVSNWGSYAATVLNHNGSFSFSSIGIGSSPSPNYFKNMANGILTHKGHRIITDCKFENLGIGSIPTPSSFALYGYAIYGTGSASTGDKLTINGYGTWLQDMQNVKNGVYAHDMNLDMNNVIVNNISETAIRIERTSSTAVESKITNNAITARYPISIAARTGDIVQIANNTISDVASLQNNGSLIDISGTAANLVTNASNKIENNLLTVNNSQYGIRINGVSGNSTTNRYQILSNRIHIPNSNPSNITRAGIYQQNANNYNYSDNNIYMSLSNTITTARGNPMSLRNQNNLNNLLINPCPIGIHTNTIQNTRISCNNFYTQTGTYHENSHGTGASFELLTNNYVTRAYGVLFSMYLNTYSTIRGFSNKFYCSQPDANFMVNLTSGSTNRPNVSFPATGGALGHGSVCIAPPLPFCSSNPSSTPLFRFYPFGLSGTFFGLGNAAANDNTCQIVCNLPKMASATPLAAVDEVLTPSCELYPNPGQERFHLRFDQIDLSERSLEIDILDMQGRLVYHTHIDKPQLEQEFTLDLPAGNYLVRLELGLGLHFVKRLTIDK